MFFERGVRAAGRVQDRRGQARHPLKLSDTPQRPWQGMVDRWRQHIRAAIEAHLPPGRQRAAGILAGLTVGDQSAIEREDWDLFRQTGISHLVSISGAHIAMFGWLAAGLVRRLWARWPKGMHWRPAPVVALWSAVLASAAYALLAGWGVPAQRTVWMMLLAVVLRTSGRRWPWPLLWLVSAVALTAIDPWAIRQVGFWLSYFAVGVLMMSGGWLDDKRALTLTEHLNDHIDERLRAWPGSSANSPWLAIGRVWLALVSAMASAAWAAAWALVRLQWLITAALLPLSLVCFQQASLSSLVANLLAIPVFTVGITPLAMLGTLWSPCWDAGVWLIDALLNALSWLAGWWPAMASSPVLPWWAVWACVLAGLGLALPMHWRWRLGLLPCVLPLLYLPQGMRLLPPPLPGAFSVVAVDVGQGTAVLVRTAHHGLLFDTGPRIGERLNAGDRTLLPLFRAMGLGRLDTLMISHQDTDHVGGAAAIVRQMPVAGLLSSLDASHPLRQQPGVDGQPLPHAPCVAGSRWDWDGVAFEVLHPWPRDYADRAHRASNAMSCVLKVSAAAHAGDEGPRSLLLTGDIEADQESALAEQAANRLPSTVLIAPHHGSQTSSTDAFMRKVQPGQVVIQVGRRNRYGHPSPPVLARYEAMGINWVASPDCGAYVWYSDEPASKATPAKGLPRIGSCWRPAHHRYWDQPSAMPGDASP
jgi:competence protein ComEC